MQQLVEELQKRPIAYITKDLERALGFGTPPAGFYGIANASELAIGDEQASHFFLLSEKEQLNTRQLLLHHKTLSFLAQHSIESLIVFKPNTFLEHMVSDAHLTLLNPSAALATRVEEKVSQVEWLGELRSRLPSFSLSPTKEVLWKGEPFILQFNHGHTGQGTVLIQSEADLVSLREQFPDRPARCSTYITGPIFTLTSLVTPQTTLCGSISYQITGLPPFTDNPFATIGNDWALPHTLLTENDREEICALARAVGDKLRQDGWKGLFGIDVIVDEKTRTISLLEVNARQPASATFESHLQEAARIDHLREITLFEGHIASLLDIDCSDMKMVQIEHGAQLVQRVTRYTKRFEPTRCKEIEQLGVACLLRNNTKLGSELAIIRTKKDFMAGHGTLNEEAKKLL